MNKRLTLLIKRFGYTLLLLWFCWLPEAKPDLTQTYSKFGWIETHRSGAGFIIFNEKKKHDITQPTYVSFPFYGDYNQLGASAGLKITPQLNTLIIKNRFFIKQKPLEVVFAKDRGNALFKKDLVVEIRLDGQPLAGYSKEERLQDLKDCRLRGLYISIVWFLLIFPFILKPNLFKLISGNKST